jgi:hypothetical protein
MRRGIDCKSYNLRTVALLSIFVEGPDWLPRVCIVAAGMRQEIGNDLRRLAYRRAIANVC